jgi:hypothetical protein
MELTELFGIPAQPLIVHAAVVLLPLAALGTIINAGFPKARQHYALLVLGVAMVATTAVWLAEGSGESLEERVDETHLVEEHSETAGRVLPWAIALTCAAAAVTIAVPLRRRYPQLDARSATAVLVLAASVTGIGATWTVVEVGHSGAKATWDDLPPEGG